MPTISFRAATVLALLLALPAAVRAQDAVADLNAFLDGWHHAAAVAAESTYFAAMDSDAVYLGTDPGERWSKAAFREWAKPYFARGKAWAFTPFDRHVTLAPAGDFAWFDEKLKWFDTNLNTWMGTLRGSGVIRRTSAGWRIAQYNLTMELPNDRLGDVVRLLRVSHAVAPADAKAIMGAARGFLNAVASRDSAALRALLDSGARVSVVVGNESTASSTVLTVAAYERLTLAASGHDSIPETMVLGDGTVAYVWAPYVRYTGTKAVGCGLDQFQLTRGEPGWRITMITVHQFGGCPGPP